MKLSATTIAILKNFSSIGVKVSLLLKPGKVQSIIDKDATIYAEATFEEDFPVEFGISDIPAFVNNLSLFKDPEITFESSSVAVIGDSDFNISYRGSSPKIILSPPENIKDVLKIDRPDATFWLSSDALSRIIKVSSLNSFPNIAIIGKNGDLFMKAFDKENDLSNTALVKIALNTGSDFSAIFKTDYLNKLLPQDYEVELNLQGFAKFSSKNLSYTISMEA